MAAGSGLSDESNIEMPCCGNEAVVSSDTDGATVAADGKAAA